MATIIIPSALRQYAGQQEEVRLPGGTVDAVLEGLTAEYPDLRKQIFSESGKLRNFVNIYLNDEDIRYLRKGETPVGNDDTISIIPAIAGGRGAAAPAVPVGQRDGERDAELSHEEIRRYSRHLILPEVGMEGQKKLKKSSVLLIGAGGLGSPLGLYLAAAGVGRIGLVDFDVVDFSNLQRQVLHGTPDVGRPKLQSARDRLEAINPEVRLDLYETRLTSTNAMQILGPYDVVIDGTDNFPTRYLVNDACVLLGKPNVY